MTLYTSPSSPPDQRAHRNAMAALLTALILSYLLAVIYSILFNPEVRFWKEAYKRKIEWARTLTTEGKTKLVFIGGSSTAFQIDAAILTEAGIPSVNMGMHAGMGSRATAAFGLSAVARGDTVIWAFERNRLTKDPELDPLGYQTLVATGVIFHSGPQQLALQGINPINILNALRPGLDHCAVMLAKVALRYPLYRYKEECIRPGGAITTDEIRTMPSTPLKQNFPSNSTLLWISSMNSRLAEIDCNTAYLLQHCYVPPEDAEAALAANRSFLEILGHITYVVPDPVMGVVTSLQCFADTPYHLRSEAMEQRTDDLIPLLREAQIAPSATRQLHNAQDY
jgi:hypothetical protein